MEEAACELCGNISQLGNMRIHHIVPEEIAGQAGISDSATTRLCRNCHQEVNAWYAGKVSVMAYDSKNKRFQPRSPEEMVKEYETTYRAFAEYKKGQRKTA